MYICSQYQQFVWEEWEVQWFLIRDNLLAFLFLFCFWIFAENRGDIWFFFCELPVFNGESKFLTVLPLNWIEVLSVPLLNIQIADILPMRTLYFLWYFRSNMFRHIWVWDWQSNEFGILPHKLGRFLLTQECTVLKIW